MKSEHEARSESSLRIVNNLMNQMKLTPVIVIILTCIGYSLQQTCEPNPCRNGATCYNRDAGGYYCACADDFEGDNCENFNVCRPGGSIDQILRCLNGGTCINNATMPEGYQCQCPPQYEGNICQTIKTCEPNPCRNGAICYNGNGGGYICDCAAGFDGENCDHLIDACQALQPCQNGGTCFLNSNPSGLGYICRCPPLFTGTNCQTSEPNGACSSDPCMNGGTCFRAHSESGSKTLICVCLPGYNGTQCESILNPEVTGDICETSQPCHNRGTCFISSMDNANYMCMCTQGYSGVNCTISSVPEVDPIDLCLTNDPCENNSTCVHLTGASSVRCQCAPGYVGEYCHRVDTGSGPCLPNPCNSGGTCNPDPFAVIGYSCSCEPTFSGVNCELEYFGCISNPCQNSGICTVQTFGTYFCDCPEGYSGRLCEIAGPCALSPCLNMGTCMENPQIRDPTRAYNCICPQGFMGTHCEQLASADPCDPNPCNSGTCFKSGSSSGEPFICLCPDYTVGELCNDDPCLSQPCLNGGSCNPIFNPATQELVAIGCVCPTGYTGPTCAIVGPCQSNPCQNDGTCIDSSGSSPDPLMDWEDWPGIQPSVLAFFCMCTSEWAGITCSETSDPCSSNPCENSGECYRMEEGGYMCICQALYTGPRCQTRVEPCEVNPCQNSGRCVQSGQMFSCVCSQPYVGNLCERIDPCASSPCENGATCFRSWREEEYICQCTLDFTGDNCQNRVPFVICPDATDPFGSAQNPIDPLSPSSSSQITFLALPLAYFPNNDNVTFEYAVNGEVLLRIQSSINTWYHTLSNLQTGVNQVVVTARDPYGNSATCSFTYERLADVFVICPDATNPLGDNPIDPLSPSPSPQFSFLPPAIGNFPNNDEVRYTYTVNNNPLVEIQSSPAIQTHSLTNLEEGPNVVDVEAWDPSGNRATCTFTYERQTNNCWSQPCQNGGVCFNGGTNGFVCLCPGTHTGELCQDPIGISTTTISYTTTPTPRTTQFVPGIGACRPNPCHNGGSCLPVGSDPFSYTCLCLKDYAGLTCVVHLEPVGPCDSHPCLNGGTCILNIHNSGNQGEFFCICGNGFAGNTCALPIATPTTTTAGPTANPTASTPTSPTKQTSSTCHQVSDDTSTSTTQPQKTTRPQLCFHDESVYEEGATRVKDCVRCTCINGQWLCGERDCDCMIDGVRYSNSDMWSVDCNTCICSGGVDICTELTCGTTCVYNGGYFANGMTRQSECNACVCEEGNWFCSDDTCDDTCVFGGETFFVGETRKESCNSCFCLKDAQWLCTVRDCKGSPIIITVSFKINEEFYVIENSQQRFISVFKDDMRERYNLAKQNIQNVMVFAGSIEVMFDLVEVKNSNIDVQAIASDLENKIQNQEYTLHYEGYDMFADPASFKHERLITGPGPSKNQNTIGGLEQSTVILIAVIGCGILGLIVVITSVCYFTRHTPRRARTEYGDARLPTRATDQGNSEDGFVNIAYQESFTERDQNNSRNPNTNTPRSYTVEY